MKNIFVYIISAIILGLVVIIYANDVLSYGVDIKTTAIFVAIFVLILILGIIALKFINKKIYNKDKNSG